MSPVSLTLHDESHARHRVLAQPRLDAPDRIRETTLERLTPSPRSVTCATLGRTARPRRGDVCKLCALKSNLRSMKTTHDYIETPTAEPRFSKAGSLANFADSVVRCAAAHLALGLRLHAG